MENLWQVEIQFTLFLQGLGLWLEAPMKAVTSFGQEEFFLVVMPAIYWCFDSMLGFRVGLMLSITNMTNHFFKVVFHGARPYWLDRNVQALIRETSFGIPSGHAQNATSMWGLLTTSVRRSWVKVFVVALIFLIGLSRIYLGVHFTSDVLAGWFIGVLLIVAFVKLEKPVAGWFLSHPLGQQMLILVTAAFAFILIPLIPIQLLSNWVIPQLWIDNALFADSLVEIVPLSRAGAFTIAGTFLGLTAGVAWLYARRGIFDAGGPVWQRLLRYLIGIAGVAILYLGLKAIFPDGENLTAYAFRTLRYILVSSWVAVFAPLLFVQLGLGRFKLVPQQTAVQQNPL
jgi:membrane-associated phospholipid phosphatase